VKKYDPFTADRVFPGDAWEVPAFCGPNGGNCVEVNLSAEGVVGIRDGKLVTGPVLVFDDVEWRAFVSSARAGQYDR